MPDAFVTPDAIAVCQHPDGEELHVPLADMIGGHPDRVDLTAEEEKVNTRNQQEGTNG